MTFRGGGVFLFLERVVFDRYRSEDAGFNGILSDSSMVDSLLCCKLKSIAGNLFLEARKFWSFPVTLMSIVM